MISYKCRSCGGDMKVISKGMGECLYCTGIDSMPTIDSEKFNRAEKLRREHQYFDEAADLYKQIIAENPDEEEAYWGLVLCKFGIEYVRDIDEELKPTCHRTIETPILDDVDYKLACEKADEEKRKHYQKQAKKIQTIQSNILDVVRNQKPYDIFISFKSKDENGNPTIDCNEARKIYYKLKEQNYTVFFSEETLETGKEYEPQIYAALKTAKIMILIGSREEYVEATWVKNEWKRFKRMIDNGEKKTIIPICIDMDPYKLPMDLKMYQAINWRDSEAMLTLNTAVENIVDKKTEASTINIGEAYKKYEQEKIEKKLVNARLYLEVQGRDNESIALLNEIIKDDPENYEAYWLRLEATFRRQYNITNLIDSPNRIKTVSDYMLAVKYAPENKKKEYTKIADAVDKRCGYTYAITNICNRYKELSDDDGRRIVDVMSKLAQSNKCINATSRAERVKFRVGISIFLVTVLVSIIMLFMEMHSYNEARKSLDRQGISFNVAEEQEYVTPEMNEMEKMSTIACVFTLAISFVNGLITAIIAKQKGYFLCWLGGVAVWFITLSVVSSIVYQDMRGDQMIFLITSGAMYLPLLPCLFKNISYVYTLCVRRRLVSQYRNNYSLLCKMLDEKIMRAYNDMENLYAQYSKVEPVEYEIKKSPAINEVVATYERFKATYNVSFN